MQIFCITTKRASGQNPSPSYSLVIKTGNYYHYCFIFLNLLQFNVLIFIFSAETVVLSTLDSTEIIIIDCKLYIYSNPSHLPGLFSARVPICAPYPYIYLFVFKSLIILLYITL